MKHSRRLLSAILVFIFILSALVSCAESINPEETTETPTSTSPLAAETTVLDETTAYEPDDLKEKYDFNETITFFIWSDHRMREYYAEDSGDNIDIAIYNRNIKVAERLGIEIIFAE
jgi:ABC-type transport system substrate-binding protein